MSKRPAPLSRSQQSALLCYAGIEVPLWAYNRWTVATVKALHRRGYLTGPPARITRKGRAAARRLIPKGHEQPNHARGC